MGGRRVYRRSGVWDGKAWGRNLGGLCSRRVWVGDAPDGGAARLQTERRLGWEGVGTEPRRLVLAAGLGGRRA